MTKRGRKANHYVTKSGEPIVGLRQNAKSGRFYPVGKGSPNFGTDEARAIQRFHLWRARQDQQGDPLETRSSVDDLVMNELDAETLAAINPTMLLESPIVARVFEAHHRELIYSDPNRAATVLDCEPLRLLANIKNLKPRPPSKRLSELCDTYLNDKSLTPKEAANSRTWWDEFTTITGAKVVADLNQRAFKRYRETIKKRQGKRSNAWVRSRFGKVKTIIRHVIEEKEVSENEQTILSLVSLLKRPSKPSPRPIDIDPDELQAILAEADEWEAALILIALNAAYTNIDCQRLRWDMVDTKKRLIRFDRAKAEHLTNAELPRICYLWKRTIDALTKIKNGHTNVFVSSLGQPAHIDTINDRFVACCKRAGIEKRLTFKHLRKSALTAASNDESGVPDRQVNLLAGHSAGIKDHYVVRKNVQLACEAIERYYFGA